MAWLPFNGEGALTGWGPPPQLHGGNVEGIASALLAARIKQQQLVQDSLQQAMKDYQSNRAGNAILQQAGAMGLPEAGALQGTGMEGAKGYESLAALMEQAKLRQMQEKLYGAHGDYFRAMTDWVNSGGKNVSKYGTQSTVSITDKDGNVVNVPAGSRLGQQILAAQNPTLVPKSDSTVNTILRGYGLTRADILNSAGQQGFLGGQPLPKDQPWQNADEFVITPQDTTKQAVRLPKDTFLSLKQSVLGQPIQPNAAPGIRQDDVDQQTLQPTKLAPGYGVQAVKMQAPDGTVSDVDPNLVEHYKSLGAVVIP
jgi:hypothetical protein